MTVVTTTQSDKKARLVELVKERSRINNEIAKLTHKASENEEKAGYVYYMHSKFEPVPKGESSIPRVSIAAYVDHYRKELYYGLKVWTKTFNRKVGRHKALGKALSVKYRKIARLTATDKDTVRDKMFDILEKAQLTAIQNLAKNNKLQPTAAVRVKVADIVKKQLSQNGTH